MMMTVEEYRQLPDREDVIQELHLGTLVSYPDPRWGTPSCSSG